MPTFSATAQSSSAIEVSWNLTDVDPGYLFDALSITQTAPDGQQTPQNLPPNDVVQIGTTLFTGLQPNTTYTYVIYAVWDDGQGGIGFTYNPQPGITCVTKAAQSASSGTQGTGSSSTNAGPALGPITGLTAKWNAPDYNQVTVDFTAGKNSTAAVTQFKGPSNYKTSTVIYRNAIQPPDKSVPISFAVEHLKPGAYTITVTETYKTYSNSATYYLAAPPPPGALTDVSASWNAGYSAVILSWKQGSGTTTTSMTLQRFAGEVSASGTPPEPVQIPLTSPYTDTPTSITSSSQYQYKLTASNAFGQTSASSNLLGPPTAPAAPGNVVAEWSVKYTQAKVTWDADLHADSYEVVLFRTDGDGPFQSILRQAGDYPNITSTSFTGPLTGQYLTSYQYQVIAHNRFGSNSSALTNAEALLVPAPSSPSTSEGSTPDDPGHTLIKNTAP
jgi:hypothetical protein